MARRKRNRDPQTAVIVSSAHDGRGIADCDGKKVFVAGALPGEEVTFRRRKFRRNYDEAELLEVNRASPDRIEARCAAFGQCGGCSLQHVTPDYQRDLKLQTLKDNLQRIGQVSPDRWLDTLAGADWNYRRRARLAVKDVHGKGRTLVGFRERHAPYVTDMLRCEVLVAPLDSLIADLSTLLDELTIRARVPQIEVAVADNATALVFRVLDPPSEADVARLCAFGRSHSLRIYLQPGGLDSLELIEPSTIDAPLCYDLDDFDVRLEFEPVDFVQVNAAINQRMVSAAVDLLGPQGDERVLDLFCGIGNFSLPLARRSAEVLGVEGDSALVARARHNAAQNGLENATFRAVDLTKIDGTESWVRAGWDALLLDPARSGAQDVVSRIELFAPQRIVYVSCHPGTLARDAGILVNEKGYQLEAAGIIDMFPHTAHVESIALFRKR